MSTDPWIILPPPAVQLAWLTAQQVRLTRYLEDPPHRLPESVTADIVHTLEWLQAREIVVRGLLTGQDASPAGEDGSRAWLRWEDLGGATGESNF